MLEDWANIFLWDLRCEKLYSGQENIESLSLSVSQSVYTASQSGQTSQAGPSMWLSLLSLSPSHLMSHCWADKIPKVN